jgi:tetratricopeptide (TPR) repeat protein
MNYFMKYFSLFLIFFWGTKVSLSQSKNLDSLWTVYSSKTQADTSRLRAIHTMAWSYIYDNPDSAIALAKLGLQLSIKAKQRKFEERTLSILGVAYANEDNYPKALEYDLKSLKISEEIGDLKGIGNEYISIGIIYFYQLNYSKSLEYYAKALETLQKIGDKSGEQACYVNMGNTYFHLSNYSKSLENHFKALELSKETGEMLGVANSLMNIGITYSSLNDNLKALEYFRNSLKISREIGDKNGMGNCYGNMSELYNRLANFKLATMYGDSGFQIAKEIKDIEGEMLYYENRATSLAKSGRYKEAYENHVKFKQLTDSIFNEENSKQLGDMKTRFEVEKKETELKAKADAQQVITNEEKKRQQLIIYVVGGVLVMVIVFSGFLYNRFRVIRKQKKVIEEQKVLVDFAYAELHEKNQQVIDSINYAKRIQTALLTSEKYIERNLNRLSGKT